MAAEDWLPNWDGDEDWPEPSCIHCGRTILWVKGPYGKWVAHDYYSFNSSEPHRCKARVASAREFPKLED